MVNQGGGEEVKTEKFKKEEWTICNSLTELPYKEIDEADYIYSITRDLLVGIENIKTMIPETRKYYEEEYVKMLEYLVSKKLNTVQFLRYAYARARLSAEVCNRDIGYTLFKPRVY